MSDLGERSFHALSVGLYPDTNLKPAVRCEPYCRLLETWCHRNTPVYEHVRSVCRLFGVGGEADSYKPAVWLAFQLAHTNGFKVDFFHRCAHALGIVPTVVVFFSDVSERHRIGGHKIFESHLGRLTS